MPDVQKVVNEYLPDANDYQKFLLTWIIDTGIKNKESFNYNNIKDITIGIYLLCKDLKLDPTLDDNKFVEYFYKQYGYGSLVHKLILDIAERKPDLLELLSEISCKDYNNTFMSSHDFNKHIETLYNTEKLSEEENKETLIFGDNILNGEMTVRQLSDIVRMMTKEYVGEYITHLKLGEITFNISDSSVMYLKDSDGIKLAVITAKNDTPKHIIQYNNENNSELFLLFEPESVKTEIIYGLSLNAASNEDRNLLILEKDKDDIVYRFLFGKDEL